MLHTTEAGLILYCIVYVVYVPHVHFKHGTDQVKIHTKFEYVHAENAAHAKGIFNIGKNYRRLKRKGIRLEIIEVAPAIGWHAADDNGDVLHADYNSVIKEEERLIQNGA